MDNDEYRKLRSCLSKIMYTSEREVDNAIMQIRRFSHRKMEGKPRRYFCDYDRDTNPHWHITHTPKRGKKSAPRSKN